MRYLTLFLLLIPVAAFPQKPTIFSIDSIPQQGLLLDKGWKWHAGDNADFAKPDFNDSAWESIDPTKDIFDLPQLPKNGEIFWLRLAVSADSLSHQQLVMAIQQSGASEIYLNGKLIQAFGTLTVNKDKIKAYSPLNEPFSFQIQRNFTQILAVRYAFQPHIFYGTHFANTNKCFSIEIIATENWFKKNKIQQYASTWDLIVLSIYATLCILYFAFYLFFPAQKINLYFTIYTALQGIPAGFIGLFLNQNFVENRYWIFNALLFFLVTGSLFLLLAIYRLFGKKTGIVFWLIVALGVISVPMALFIYRWGWVVYGMVFNLCVSFEILRVALLGVSKNRKGSWIIASGGFIFFIFWMLFVLGTQINANLVNYAPYFYAMAQVSFPISVAIFLGYDFAQTNRSLQQKLAEVETLSSEKQQILAAQNETLEKQVEERTLALKASQTQLIQSEKLASLGELTAGIAHEIQNPLNFVNNFSEVSKELLDEMKTELDNGNTADAKGIAEDVIQNLEKINHHGKRADAIVKGMLQHSQSSSGLKEPTNINKLADEYLRLAYHGLLAKDKTFILSLKTEFDDNIGSINIIPQDIGRVLLNLYNNAFYAVDEKKKQTGESYNPTVSVSTKRITDKVLITVRDNGKGIPQKVVDKIFQPFFTTKPTGQGTGLGLSLAYDIVKTHGGELKVETKEGEGSAFIIQLPVV